MKPSKLIYLPGSAGNASFWQPAAQLIKHDTTDIFIEWPGIAGVKPDPAIKDLDTLAQRVSNDIDEPTALIAQSMGGMVAILALLKKPELITHLVLTVTSAGVKVDDLRPHDWRPDYLKNNPSFPTYFSNFNQDLTEEIKSLDIPVLLIWGDNDPISPVSIGKRLQKYISNSKLHVISGGEHNLANVYPNEVASIIKDFIF